MGHLLWGECEQLSRRAAPLEQGNGVVPWVHSLLAFFFCRLLLLLQGFLGVLRQLMQFRLDQAVQGAVLFSGRPPRAHLPRHYKGTNDHSDNNKGIIVLMRLPFPFSSRGQSRRQLYSSEGSFSHLGFIFLFPLAPLA